MVTTTQFWFVEPYMNFSFEIIFGGAVLMVLWFLVLFPFIILFCLGVLSSNDN